MSLKLDLLAAIALLSFEPPTQAHDIYLHLKDRLGNSCCDDKDCRPALYRVTPTGRKCSSMVIGLLCQSTRSSIVSCPRIRGKQLEGTGAGISAMGMATR
jgi:hypothetical protein